MKLSKSSQAIEPSLTRKLFNMAQQFDDVINLTLGDPDTATPATIREAACECIMQNKTRYSANAGLIELRGQIASSINDEYSLSVKPDENVIVTVGGMEGLYLSILSIVDEGDEVIIPAPYYVNYVQMVKMRGGVPVIVYSYEEDGFTVRADAINRAVTDKTVAIILNTPCNPTGSAIDKATLLEISKIACAHDLWVISDEVYRTLLFDGAKHESIINMPKMQERTVLIDSLSKKYSMTGYRIGCAIAPTSLIAAMTKLQENVAACAPLPSQYAAISAYRQNVPFDGNVNEFTKRRDMLFDAINSISGLSCLKPQGTFYLFVNIKKLNMSSVNFAYLLLERQHVAVVPGLSYGDKYDGYIRIAFTQNVEVLTEAVRRIGDFVASL